MQSGPGMRKQSDSKRRHCVTRFALRTKLIDDQVLAALSDSKVSEDQPEAVRQVVVLGAGMDTRAWRMDLPEGTAHLYSCLEHAGTWMLAIMSNKRSRERLSEAMSTGSAMQLACSCFRTVITYRYAVHDQLSSHLQTTTESSLCLWDAVKALCTTFVFLSEDNMVSRSGCSQQVACFSWSPVYQ